MSIKSISFEFLYTYNHKNFKSFIEALWKSINYFREFHVLLSGNFRTCSGSSSITEEKGNLEFLEPGQKGA
ncbi:hypothetical protein MSSAC_0091 [Methanosarcina siciliae C2J]|uniref:Uncharacterized protein n=1 Tax=Methanosarcina siciliae C2J TaxID=1434118 RepID=A0A0E3LC05_9EURY|nr:hypothetical protein MSSAC_0091 [Methanosarcina siciliae C2J]